MVTIFQKFFFLQYRAAIFKGRIPVSRVDHPLDEKIPFTPSWVGVYLDFVYFWIRTLGFYLRHFKKAALIPVRDFTVSMGELYSFAAQVFAKNMSTTNRPHYFGRPRFVLIHAVDPHLMCIPSLHVMVMIRTYTSFRAIITSLGGQEQFTSQIEEVRAGAMAITEAILFVKQHSVNCIAAAMYAMTRFDPSRFPEDEAEAFAAELFKNSAPPSPADAERIRAHILALYRGFIAEGKSAADWKDPLLNFLKTQPQKH
jgi:hypothetical protein